MRLTAKGVLVFPRMPSLAVLVFRLFDIKKMEETYDDCDVIRGPWFDNTFRML